MVNGEFLAPSVAFSPTSLIPLVTLSPTDLAELEAESFMPPNVFFKLLNILISGMREDKYILVCYLG